MMGMDELVTPKNVGFVLRVLGMAAAKPIAASGTGAPFCWLRVPKPGTPGAETGTGWTTPGRCLQAW